MTARHPDWAECLALFLLARRAQPFAWGTNDCCMFAADAVQAMTGVDHAAEYRGQYSDAAGAARLLGAGVEPFADRALGERIAWPLARRGDVVLANIEGRRSLGICDGAYVVGPGDDALMYLPMADVALAAWRV